MASANRSIKTFTEVSERIFDGSNWQPITRLTPDIDTQVNDWIKETNAVIIQATPGLFRVTEKLDTPTSYRLSNITKMTIIYMDSDSFIDTEASIRRLALCADGYIPKAKKVDVPSPAGDITDAGGPPMKRESV